MKTFITFTLLTVVAVLIGLKFGHPIPGPADPAVRKELASFFSSDYLEARERFIDLCSKHKNCKHQKVWTLPNVEGDLSVDVARIGPANAKHILAISSGLHGVEGFVGSALQLQMLTRPSDDLPSDLAIVLIHALNPYGMCKCRRFNYNNVDLNRNSLRPDDAVSGVPKDYEFVRSLLEVQESGPMPYPLFMFNAIIKIIRYGMGALVEAVASGQRDYPNNVFYGGSEVQPELKALHHFFRTKVLHKDLERIRWLDIHTGLGPYGSFEMVPPPVHTTPQDIKQIIDLYGDDVLAGNDTVVPYSMPGELLDKLGDIVQESYPKVDALFTAIEFGTYWNVHALYYLLGENHCHVRGGQECSLKGYWKQGLKEQFSPASDVWKAAVVEGGSKLIDKAYWEE